MVVRKNVPQTRARWPIGSPSPISQSSPVAPPALIQGIAPNQAPTLPPPAVSPPHPVAAPSATGQHLQPDRASPELAQEANRLRSTVTGSAGQEQALASPEASGAMAEQRRPATPVGQPSGGRRIIKGLRPRRANFSAMVAQGTDRLTALQAVSARVGTAAQQAFSAGTSGIGSLARSGRPVLDLANVHRERQGAANRVGGSAVACGRSGCQAGFKTSRNGCRGLSGDTKKTRSAKSPSSRWGRPGR